MTKKEFVDDIAIRGEITKKEAENLVNLFLETVSDNLERGNSVGFVGWGKWEVMKRAAREVRNPQTGNKMKIKAKKVVKFRVGKVLEEKIAKSK
ncbi:MAG: HU family DNA-binding protein [Fusobacterium sp. JB021]|nr:HU family DNA-binding protein [Fusobacterium sp. JB020]MDP0493642.1 HU family DNA-binding protein [Fusobacterium sp. JB021]MDP0507190.1 HU family DNA-binding protein [Fusobacterium sp. JB019]